MVGESENVHGRGKYYQKQKQIDLYKSNRSVHAVIIQNFINSVSNYASIQAHSVAYGLARAIAHHL